MKLSTTSALSFLLVAGKMSQGAFADKIRFMKFGVEGTDEASCKEPIEYPIDAKSAKMLREDTNAISVMLPSEGCSGVSFDELTESLGHVFPPTHPDDENSTYWKELKEVAFAVSELKKYEKSYDFGSKVYALPDPLPTVMPRITNLWNGIFDIVEVAKAVQDEFPGVYHAQLITKWLEEKSLDRKPFLFQTMNNRDFLRFPVMLSDMVGHAIRMVGPCDFALKWFVGRARPEEVAWKIRSAAGKSLVVPPSEETNELIKIIDEMEFSKATEFTAYVEGSPNHPSYPAMHSAASAASFWLDVVMDLTEDQLCEARMLDYSISYARTVAGVHYASDNIAGLMVGQKVLAEKLPQYLHDEYGADFTLVKKEVERASMFDWTTFNTTECWMKDEYKTVAKNAKVTATE